MRIFASCIAMGASVCAAWGQCEPEVLATLGGRARAVVICDNFAFVANTHGGLLVYDVSDPESVDLVGAEQTTREAWDVDIESGLAFVADFKYGLRIVDVSDPTSMEAIGELELKFTDDTYIHTIDVRDDVACLVSRDVGLLIVDVSDPTSPDLRIRISETPIADVRIVGEQAIYVTHDGRLVILDISEPGDPTVLSNTQVTSHIDGIEIESSVAFVAAREDGVLFLDVSDPSAPRLVGTYPTPGDANSVSVDGDLAFVAQGDTFDDLGALHIVDVSDLALPRLLSTTDFEQPERLDVNDDLALVCDEFNGLYALDVSETKGPVVLSQIHLSDLAGGVVLQDDVAFVLEVGSLVAYDASDRTFLRPLGWYDTPGRERRARLREGIFYIPKSGRGLEIVSASDPENMVHVGYFGDTAVDFAFENDLGVIAADEGGLWTVDLSDSTSPVLLAKYPTTEPPTFVRIFDSIAYVGSRTPMIELVDVSDPSAPRTLSTIETFQIAKDIVVADGFAYLSQYMSSVWYYDVSDPTDPVRIGDIPVRRTFGLSLSDRRLFISSELTSAGVGIVDISVPGEPVLMEIIDIDTGTLGTIARGGTLYVAALGSGLATVDIASCQACPADLDDDGDADAEDFFAYLDFFVAGDDRADRDRDGDIDAEDFFAYLDAFAVPCV